MPQTVWLARHGNRYDFVHPAWFETAERPYDPPLSADGVTQAQELGQRLQGEQIARVFASPFLRTVQTAHYVARALGVTVALEAGLSEWLNPDWMAHAPQTLPPQVLAASYPEIDLSYTARVVPSYPESSEAAWARTARTAQCLVRDFPQDFALIGHGASVMGVAAGLLGGHPSINASLCALIQLVREGQDWRLALAGDTSHLSQPETVVRFN